MPEDEYFIFSDASFDPALKWGVGARLVLTPQDWPGRDSRGEASIQTTVMASDSIARLELMTALWALTQFRLEHPLVLSVKIFTDCKAIVDLPGRRLKLEANHYQSQRTGLSLANADLYRKFFELYDQIQPAVVWNDA